MRRYGQSALIQNRPAKVSMYILDPWRPATAAAAPGRAAGTYKQLPLLHGKVIDSGSSGFARL